MPFPDTPFEFEDSELVAYLKNLRNWGNNFFSKDTLGKIDSLKAEDDLATQKEVVKSLWPMVLTDALLLFAS